MRNAILPVFALLLMAPLASAEVPAEQSDQSPLNVRPPKTIWLLQSDGTALHKQTGLRCPSALESFRLENTIAYDKFGLDVSCSERDGHNDVVTMYLTQRHGQTLSDDFETAKSGLLHFTPDAKPISGAESTFPSSVSWQSILYSERGGSTRSGIWIADMSGWTFEFRATYVPDQESTVFAALSALTAAATSDAGANLVACLNATSATREGRRITDQATLLTLEVSGAASIKMLYDSDHAIEHRWCPAAALTANGHPFLLWRDANDAQFDRVTAIDTGAEAEVAIDELADAVLVHSTGNGAVSGPVFDVFRDNGDKVLLIAIYDGKIPIPDLVAIAGADRNPVYGEIEKAGKHITLYAPY